MDIEKLQEIVRLGESDTLEFKKSTANIHSAIETITAFLNGHGGSVLLGITDSGKITGQDVSDNTKREIAKEVAKIEPTPQILIDYVVVSPHKKVIVLSVKKGEHAPYAYDGRAFQRLQSTTQRMSQHRYEQLLIERGQLDHTWESYVTDYDINSLDHDRIYFSVSEGVRHRRIPATAVKSSLEDILKRFDLIEGKKLKNAAIALFSKEEVVRLPQCIIKMIRFDGTDKLGAIIDSTQIYANAFLMLDMADEFLRRHLPIASFFDVNQFQRTDKPALPVIAVREALVNAVCHRDYADYAGAVTVAIYNDRLEIWNNGKLPSELKISDLAKEHGSWTRNKLIANVFYLMGLIENWGTGTNRMIAACKNEGLPTPTFKESFGGILVTFKFKSHIKAGADAVKIDVVLTKRQQDLLEIIKAHGKIGIEQIMIELQETVPKRTLQKDLNDLKEMGLIALEGIGRGASWSYVNENAHKRA